MRRGGEEGTRSLQFTYGYRQTTKQTQDYSGSRKLLKSTDSCGRQSRRRGNGRYRLCVWGTWGSAIGQIHDTTRGGRLCCAVLLWCGAGVLRLAPIRGAGAGRGRGRGRANESGEGLLNRICWRCRLHKSCASALACFLPW